MSLTLRLARPADAAWLLALRNDAAVRQQSTTPRRVSRAAHARWMAEMPVRARACWVAWRDGRRVGGRRVGYVRIDWSRTNGARRAVVSVAVARRFRRKGFGAQMLWRVEPLARDLGLRQLEANVRSRNVASLRCFLRVGYRITGATAEWVRLLREG